MTGRTDEDILRAVAKQGYLGYGLKGLSLVGVGACGVCLGLSPLSDGHDRGCREWVRAQVSGLLDRLAAAETELAMIKAEEVAWDAATERTLAKVAETQRAADAAGAENAGLRAVVAAVREENEQLRGDLNHLMQPLIGSLRLAAASGVWDHTRQWTDHYVDRLRLVLALMDEVVDGVPVSQDWRNRHGAGIAHYGAALGAAVTPEATTEPWGWHAAPPHPGKRSDCPLCFAAAAVTGHPTRDEPDALHDRCLRCGRDNEQWHDHCPRCGPVGHPTDDRKGGER